MASSYLYQITRGRSATFIPRVTGSSCIGAFVPLCVTAQLGLRGNAHLRDGVPRPQTRVRCELEKQRRQASGCLDLALPGLRPDRRPHRTPAAAPRRPAGRACCCTFRLMRRTVGRFRIARAALRIALDRRRLPSSRSLDLRRLLRQHVLVHAPRQRRHQLALLPA